MPAVSFFVSLLLGLDAGRVCAALLSDVGCASSDQPVGQEEEGRKRKRKSEISRHYSDKDRVYFLFLY